MLLFAEAVGNAGSDGEACIDELRDPAGFVEEKRLVPDAAARGFANGLAWIELLSELPAKGLEAGAADTVAPKLAKGFGLGYIAF